MYIYLSVLYAFIYFIRASNILGTVWILKMWGGRKQSTRPPDPCLLVEED